MKEVQQAEALLLADEVQKSADYDVTTGMPIAAWQFQLNVAAELRRQHARIAELEAELEAIGAGGVEPLSKGFVRLSDVLERLAQGFGRESAPVTTIRSHFAQNGAQAKQGGA